MPEKALLPSVRELKAIWEDFSTDRNVHSVGIGRKVIAGAETSENCVSVG